MRPTRTSTRRRVRNTAAKNRPTMASSDAMKGLLGRQLASIADTLARASQRRDAELKEKAKPKSSIAPALRALASNDPS